MNSFASPSEGRGRYKWLHKSPIDPKDVWYVYWDDWLDSWAVRHSGEFGAYVFGCADHSCNWEIL